VSIRAGSVFAAVAVAFLLAPPALAAAFFERPAPDGAAYLDNIPDLKPAWPSSWPQVEGRPGLIRTLDAPRGYSAGLTRRPDEMAAIRELFAQHTGDEISTLRFEGPNAFGYEIVARGERTRRPPTGYPSLTFQYLSGEPIVNAPPLLDVTIQRTWFAVFEPDEGLEHAGSILLMPGLFGTPEPVLARLTAALCERGWTVLRMMAQPSRFTETMQWTLCADEEDADCRGTPMDSIVRAISMRAAECAYASRAAFDHLLRQRPHLASLPRVAIGMSGGAMTLPTVVALEPEKYAAAVMIAGGADFFTMNIQSNYQQMINAVQIDWKPGPPTEAQLAEHTRRYLKRSPLDSYHTALALRGMPMLLIHGTRDLAVPAHLGDLLWERLGRPERWSEEAGHEEIFMRLPQQIERLVGWIENAVAVQAR
jgi:hypothetical protein